MGALDDLLFEGIYTRRSAMFKRSAAFIEYFFEYLRVFWQLLYGSWRISKLPRPMVSIFGSARTIAQDRYFKKAHELAMRLVKENISVLTGGGPGIMEAASCGAIQAHNGKTMIMGIGVTDLGEKPNKCVQEYFALDYFFARKWLLTRYSKGFVIFPGGFGTLDELTEILTLIQTKKLQHVPIVLFGVEFWEPLLLWLKDEALTHKTISKEDLNLFTLTDDIDRVFCLLHDTCKVTQ